jgi:hypothetical protein
MGEALNMLFGDDRPGYKQPINQNAKGKRNERSLAKMLKKWTGVDFTRTSGSGGRKLWDTGIFAADIICADDKYEWPIVIETKALKSIDLRLTNKGCLRANSTVISIYRKTEQEAGMLKRMPLAFLRQNGMPQNEWKVFMPHQMFRVFEDKDIEGWSYERDVFWISSKILFVSDPLKFVDCSKTHYLCKYS